MTGMGGGGGGKQGNTQRGAKKVNQKGRARRILEACKLIKQLG